MTSFTNWSGNQITYKPFFQNSLNVWRIARYEDGELDMVYEQISFDNEDDCMLACMNKVSAILAMNA